MLAVSPCVSTNQEPGEKVCKKKKKRTKGEEKEREEPSAPVAGQKWSQTRVSKSSYGGALPSTGLQQMTSVTRG